MLLHILLYLAFMCIIYFLYYYKKIHYMFDSAGVKYLPGVPIFGNVWKSTLLIRHLIYDLDEVYNAFPDEKYVGFADGMMPVILIRDPELMKTIVVKDFDHFRNKKQFEPERLDPLLGRNILELKDEEWKTMRVQLTPAFTAARLRYMLPAMVDVCKSVIQTLKSSTSQEVDLTDAMYMYTGDVVTSAAFGFRDCTGARSMFHVYGPYLELSAWKRALVFFSRQFPTLGEIFKMVTGIQRFRNKEHDILRKAVAESISFRKENNLSVPDFMDVLTKISNGKSVDDLAGQMFFAFTANLISGSSILRMCFHELALNPGIQERLYQEIRNHEETETMTVESINALKYLESVLCETSRKWSAAVMMDRVCTKQYLLPPPREGAKPYLVKPGEMVFNVINPVHMDPKYHPNPDVFDPDRFSDENKHKIRQFTFMPFGMGPRICLGARFATLDMKLMIYHLVLNFRLVQCERTSNPIQLKPDEFLLAAESGTCVRLEPRE